MSKPLTICSSCQRHVHMGESACPFCGTSLEGAVPAAAGWMSRHPQIARRILTISSVAITACSPHGSGPGGDASVIDPPQNTASQTADATIEADVPGSDGGADAGDTGSDAVADAASDVGVPCPRLPWSCA